MSEWLTLEEAAPLIGEDITPSALRGKLNRGNHPWVTRKVPGPRREQWVILRTSIESDWDYGAHLLQWQRDLASGFQTGKPLKPTTLDTHLQALTYYWRTAGEPKLGKFTPERIKEVVYQQKPGMRQTMFWGCLSFYQYLVNHGLKTEGLAELRSFTPSPTKEPRRTYVTDAQFKKLLMTNDVKMAGRSSALILLTKTLLILYRHTAIRNTEGTTLTLSDVNLDRGIIAIRKENAKTGKGRKIGISPELAAALHVYLKHRPPTPHDNFFVSPKGAVLVRQDVDRYFRAVSKLAGIEITPHGLRRSFITNELRKGTPIALLRQISGHSSLAALQKYDMTTDEDAIDLLRNNTESLIY